MQAMVLDGSRDRQLELPEKPIPEPSPRGSFAPSSARLRRLPHRPAHYSMGADRAEASARSGSRDRRARGGAGLRGERFRHRRPCRRAVVCRYTDGTCPLLPQRSRKSLRRRPLHQLPDDSGCAYTRSPTRATAFHLPESTATPKQHRCLCAGLIGYRWLKMTGDAARLGVYGFGATARIVAQVARHQAEDLRPSARRRARAAFARELGAAWAAGPRRSAGKLTPPSSSRRFEPRAAALKASRKAATSCRGGPYERHPFLPLRQFCRKSR